jgi:hypothetical protein
VYCVQLWNLNITSQTYTGSSYPYWFAVHFQASGAPPPARQIQIHARQELFWELVPRHKFPNLRRCSEIVHSCFSSAYLCESTFSYLKWQRINNVPTWQMNISRIPLNWPSPSTHLTFNKWWMKCRPRHLTNKQCKSKLSLYAAFTTNLACVMLFFTNIFA